MLYAIGGVVLLVVAFFWWRIASVSKGARKRDMTLARILEPVAEKFANGEQVSSEEIDTLCHRYELRPMLYCLLNHFKHPEMFPDTCKSWECQAEGLLAYWMMHPNELQDAPVEMQCVERVERDIGGRTGAFIVVKYRMPEGHWAGHDKWFLGLSGPFVENEAPFSGLLSAFSRCQDTLENTKPGELVDWYIDMYRRTTGGARWNRAGDTGGANTPG